MSIASEITRIQGATNSIKNAIAAKGVTVPTGTKIDGCAALISSIATGGVGGALIEQDVNFYDYDGTLVSSYKLTDLPLQNLPQAPTHEDLTFQEWNYTLEEINNTTIPVNIGATYITEDGKTRLYINLEDILRNDVKIAFNNLSSNVVIVKWGDNSEEETITGTGLKILSHKYTSVGKYIISMDATNSSISFGSNSSANCVMGSLSKGNILCRNMLYKVEIGRNSAVSGHCFRNCWDLKTITIPNSVTSLGANTFYGCSSLVSVAIPNSVTNIASSVFYDCSSLVSVAIPNSVTSIGTYAFRNCYRLRNLILAEGVTELPTYAFDGCWSFTNIIIPSTVITLGTYAFRYCYSMKEYHFLSETPPTMSGTGMFNGIPSDCTIYVPLNSVDAYKTATNWVAYASYIQGE